MLKRLTILGPMLVSLLAAGSVATPALAQSKPYVDFSWDSRSGATIVHATAAGVPITTTTHLCGLVRVWGAFLAAWTMCSSAPSRAARWATSGI